MSDQPRLLVIGAGASHGARQFASPPLGRDLPTYLKKIATALNSSDCRFPDPLAGFNFSRLSNEVIEFLNQAESENCCGRGFEKAMDRLLRGGDLSILNEVNQLICFAFNSDTYSNGSVVPGRSCCFRQEADLYDQLILKLNMISKHWRVISLNYDILFEQALTRNHINWAYGHESSGPAGASWLVFKPHGSINFFALAGDGQVLQVENDAFCLTTQIAVPTPVDKPSSIDSHIRAGSSSMPIIAHYASGKIATTNPSTLAGLRTSAFQMLHQIVKVDIVGVNPQVSKADDPFLFQCFSGLAELSKSGVEVDFISPDVGCLAHHWPFRVEPKSLNEWLDEGKF